jgi:hypothetical protein
MLKKYPDEFKINKRIEAQSAPFETPQTSSYRTSREPVMQWKTPYFNSHQQQPGYNFPPQQMDTIHSYGRPNESIYTKPASTPMNLLRHDLPHQTELDHGSPLWSSMHDIKPLNLSMDDGGFRQSSGMRNIEDDLSKLILDPEDSYPNELKSADLKNSEERMMEELTKITKNLEVVKRDSFDADDDAPQRCQSSMGMIEKSLNLHEETKKLLEETSPRKTEEPLESIGESQDEDLSIPVLPEDLSIPVLPEEEDEILFAESTIDVPPEQSEMSEVITQDVTESSHGQFDFVQSLPPELQTAQLEMASDSSAESAPTNIIAQADLPAGADQAEAVASEHSGAGFEQEEQFEAPARQEEIAPEEPYVTQDEGQFNDHGEVQPGVNMYGIDESSESTVPSGEIPSLQGDAQQAVDGAGFRELELQQNPADNTEEVETLPEYDSSEMTSVSQQPEQQGIYASIFYMYLI